MGKPEERYSKPLPDGIRLAIELWVDARNCKDITEERLKSLEKVRKSLKRLDSAASEIFASLNELNEKINSVVDSGVFEDSGKVIRNKKIKIPKYKSSPRYVLSTRTERDKKLVIPTKENLFEPLSQVAGLLSEQPDFTNWLVWAQTHPFLARIANNLTAWSQLTSNNWGAQNTLQPALVWEGFLPEKKSKTGRPEGSAGDVLLKQVVATAIIAEFQGFEQATGARIRHAILDKAKEMKVQLEPKYTAKRKAGESATTFEDNISVLLKSVRGNCQCEYACLHGRFNQCKRGRPKPAKLPKWCPENRGK